MSVQPDFEITNDNNLKSLLLINLQNTRNEKTMRRPNSKIKPNRFLVCAPSNAAVDEVMKKIIVAFKEKCENKQEPLGMVYFEILFIC